MKGEKSNILVVEDNRETQLIVKVALRDSYNVELTNNAEEAIELINNKYPDLVLLDINLNGEGNGRDILQFIRENYTKEQLKVVVMTAYDLNDEDNKFFNEHANGFIPKPIDKNTICNEISRHIKQINRL